jgi:putative tryptophan/tyrosine transport system substrate-binding protein
VIQQRRVLLVPLVGLVVALGGCQVPSAVQPAQPKVFRVGYLASGSPPRSAFQEAFVQALNELGYVEGQNLTLDFRYAEGQDDRLPGLASDLAALPADVIVGASTPAVIAAKQTTTTIPIVMAAVADPVGSGLVASVSRPGGNVTGPTLLAADLAAKRVEILREAVPGASRVAVLWNPSNPSKIRDWDETQTAAQHFGIDVVSLEVRSRDDARSALDALTDSAVDALVVVGDPLTVALRADIAEAAARSQVPSMYETPDFVEAGGLIAYGPNRFDVYRRAAMYVDKILKGARPENLPVEHPTRFELVINAPAADALGLSLPEGMLLSADRIIR